MAIENIKAWLGRHEEGHLVISIAEDNFITLPSNHAIGKGITCDSSVEIELVDAKELGCQADCWDDVQLQWCSRYETCKEPNAIDGKYSALLKESAVKDEMIRLLAERTHSCELCPVTYRDDCHITDDACCNNEIIKHTRLQSIKNLAKKEVEDARA